MDADYENKVAELKRKIKSFPDFPKKGILFWDIFSAISDGPTCSLLQDLLIHSVRTKFPQAEAMVGLEARGFLFSFSLAAEMGIGCLPVRKKGKLPGDVVSNEYQLEYGSDVLEIQKNTIRPGLKCVIVDDLIATGGSVNATVQLLNTCKAEVLGCLVVMELTELNGRKNIPEDRMRWHDRKWVAQVVADCTVKPWNIKITFVLRAKQALEFGAPRPPEVRFEGVEGELGERSERPARSPHPSVRLSFSMDSKF